MRSVLYFIITFLPPTSAKNKTRYLITKSDYLSCKNLLKPFMQQVHKTENKKGYRRQDHRKDLYIIVNKKECKYLKVIIGDHSLSYTNKLFLPHSLATISYLVSSLLVCTILFLVLVNLFILFCVYIGNWVFAVLSLCLLTQEVQTTSSFL